MMAPTVNTSTNVFMKECLIILRINEEFITPVGPLNSNFNSHCLGISIPNLDIR
jgi:hypothetical protein